MAKALEELGPGEFRTLASRLARGGSLQARKLSSGVIQFYWRYGHERKTNREPIGPYDPLSPPRKLEQTSRGYSLAAALEKCAVLARAHNERARTGGLRALKQEERERYDTSVSAKAARQSQTLGMLLELYVVHLRDQGRRSFYDAHSIFELHVKDAWPRHWKMPAADISSEHVLDMLRKLIQAGKGRTSNKLRSYLHAAYQCAIEVRSTASIPVGFKAFNVESNPAAKTMREGKFDRADKRPLSLDELRIYWKRISVAPEVAGVALRVHLLTGGQRIEQFLRLRWCDVTNNTFTIFDEKGRPGGQGPRPHTLPLTRLAAAALRTLPREGEYVFSTCSGSIAISRSTLFESARKALANSINDFQPKRIRSGVETLLAANGVSQGVRGHLQSHGLTGVQTRHYDGHDYLPEKLSALKLLGRLIAN